MVVLPAAESPTTPRMIGRATSGGRGGWRTLRARPLSRGALDRLFEILWLEVLCEHARLQDVVRRDRHQLLLADHATLAEKAVRLPEPRAVDRVPHRAPVREARPPDATLEVGAHRVLGTFAEHVA